MGNEREDPAIAGLMFEARPIDVALAFAKELAIARWVLAAMAQGGGIEGMMVGAAAGMIGEAISAMAIAFGEETVEAVLVAARDEFEQRIVAAFPEGKEVVAADMDDLKSMKERARRENEARTAERTLSRLTRTDPGKPVA